MATVSPPIPKKVPHQYQCAGRSFDDPLHWLRDDDRKREDVVEHLNAENAYTQSVRGNSKKFEESLYTEFLSHIKESDEKPPVRHGEYEYYQRTVKGKDYPIHCRRPLGGGDETVVLDVNAEAEGHDFFSVGAVKVSPDHSVVAFSADTTGYETYEVKFRVISSGEYLQETMAKCSGSLAWGATQDTIYYSTLDDTHRPHKLWRHPMGGAGEDECLWTEDDGKAWLSFHKCLSGKYLLLGLNSSLTSEWRYVDLAEEGAPLRLFVERKHGVEYSIDHASGQWIIMTNDDAKNFKVMAQPVRADNTVDPASWETLLPHDPEAKVEDITCFEGKLVVEGRLDGLTSLRVCDLATREWHRVSFDEEVYEVYLGDNREFSARSIRVHYNSLTTPMTYLDYDMATRARSTVKVTEVPNYDASLYQAARWWATARDGKTRIPMSAVWRKDRRDTSKPAPLFLYGYGAYGVCNDPSFVSSRVSLLDRGVIFVIAHIRGGGEMGRHWYDDGKFLFKKNTFTDFIDCADWLFKEGVSTPSQTCISGGSAGGLLMGAVINLRPDLCRSLYTRVPFVDMMATMSDESIPLTVLEYEEWGNPHEDPYHDYMRSYSPIDNIPTATFPDMLITTGLNDSRVAYWEPAKWAVLLREKNQNPDSKILLKCTMGQGHGGASGRYKYLEERAFEYAFVLDSLSIHQ